MTFKSKVKVTVTFSTKKLIILQCLRLGPSNLVELLDGPEDKGQGLQDL